MLQLEADYNERELLEMMGALGEELMDRCEEAFIQLGDACKETAWGVVSYAEGGRGFSDVTGALRSSIGASVWRDGLLSYDNYTERGGINAEGLPLTGGNRGVTAGRRLAGELAERERSAELMLIVTAAMPYADELQTLRGRDVLASASLRLGQFNLDDIMNTLPAYDKPL